MIWGRRRKRKEKKIGWNGLKIKKKKKKIDGVVDNCHMEILIGGGRKGMRNGKRFAIQISLDTMIREIGHFPVH